MAIFHCEVKCIGRSNGRTASGSAAYRSGEKIKDNAGDIHDYTKKRGILYKEIILPDSAPYWASNRAMLWNNVDKAETRKNSTVAREYEIALPAELNQDEQAKLSKVFARYLVNEYEIAADISIHAPRKDSNNYHAHILTSTRVLGADGFGAKTRVLDSAKTGSVEIKKIRAVWEDLANQALERNGINERVSCESLKAQGIDREPQIHLGVAAAAMERRGIRTERSDHNRQIREREAEVKAAALAEAEKKRKAQEEEKALKAIADTPSIGAIGLIDPIPGTPKQAPKGLKIPEFHKKVLKTGCLYAKPGQKMAFFDAGSRIWVHSNDDATLRAALRLSAEKWGIVVLKGEPAYLKRCKELAAELNIKAYREGEYKKEQEMKALSEVGREQPAPTGAAFAKTSATIEQPKKSDAKSAVLTNAAEAGRAETLATVAPTGASQRESTEPLADVSPLPSSPELKGQERQSLRTEEQEAEVSENLPKDKELGQRASAVLPDAPMPKLGEGGTVPADTPLLKSSAVVEPLEPERSIAEKKARLELDIDKIYQEKLDDFFREKVKEKQDQQMELVKNMFAAVNAFNDHNAKPPKEPSVLAFWGREKWEKEYQIWEDENKFLKKEASELIYELGGDPYKPLDHTELNRRQSYEYAKEEVERYFRAEEGEKIKGKLRAEARLVVESKNFAVVAAQLQLSPRRGDDDVELDGWTVIETPGKRRVVEAIGEGKQSGTYEILLRGMPSVVDKNVLRKPTCAEVEEARKTKERGEQEKSQRQQHGREGFGR